MPHPFRLHASKEVLARFPGYTGLIIYAEEFENCLDDPATLQILREAEAQQRSAFLSIKPATHPHIAAWREAYSQFGTKPSKFQCSVEALLNRTVKGGELPPINRLVDLYNAVSIRHVLPVGGEDWDALASDLTLRFATGNEPFLTMSQGEALTTYPEPGEVIFADSAGVTCRAWNWRQCVRTRLTEQTRNGYFVLDRMAPYPLESLHAAGEELKGYLRDFGKAKTVLSELIGAAH